MGRLTKKDSQGNWCIKGLPWKDTDKGQVITENTEEKTYGAFCKLLDYEETGLTPDQVQHLKEREELLIDYIMRHIYSCPIRDDANIDFEKECVGFEELGCRECITRHLKELR